MMREDTGRLTMTTSYRTMTFKVAAVAMVAVLGACQSDRVEIAEENDIYDDSFQISNLAGMLQTIPDEFSVVTKRPLEMPGSFVALPAPEPGKVSSRDPTPLADARAALAFEPVPASGGTGTLSATEAAILSSAGTADPSIRATLASEQGTGAQEEYLLDRVFPRLREAREGADPNAIDAEAERLRLLEAGVIPRRTGGVSPIPRSAAALPPTQAPITAGAPASVPATPIDPGTGPVLVAPEPRSVPTLGVLAPEPVSTTPSLIYLPE